MFLYPWGDFHSLNMGWFLLQFKDWIEKIQEYLDNGGGTSENLANVIAPVFNAANYYSAGDYVLYNNELYKANQAVNPGTWNPDAWDRCLIVDEMGSGGGAGVDNVARLMIAGEYSASYGYQKYAICRYNDKLWMCNTNLPSGGEAWNAAHWDEITVGAGLTGLKRSDDTLANVIAPVFNAANYYSAGDYVLYNDELYKANQTVNPGTWNPDAWDRCLIVDEMGSGGGAGVDNVARLMIAGQYSASYGYQKYAICRYNDKLWMCNTNLPSGGEAWNAAHWDEITVGAGLTGLKRSDDTLAQQIATLNTALTALEQASNGKHYKIVCGTIRNSGSGWAVLNDSGHNPINITSVAVDSQTNSIEVGHNIDAIKVLSLVAVCDETFAQLYDVGTSVGLDSTYIYIYRKAHSFGGMIIVNNQTPDLQYSDFTLNTFYPDGGIRVNFPEPLTVAEAFRISTSGMNCICEPFSIGLDNAILKARNVATGEVYTKANIPDNTRLLATFNVDEKLVDPSTIVNGNGNIWILGLLEVA